MANVKAGSGYAPDVIVESLKLASTPVINTVTYNGGSTLYVTRFGCSSAATNTVILTGTGFPNPAAMEFHDTQGTTFLNMPVDCKVTTSDGTNFTAKGYLEARKGAGAFALAEGGIESDEDAAHDIFDQTEITITIYNPIPGGGGTDSTKTVVNRRLQDCPDDIMPVV